MATVQVTIQGQSSDVESVLLRMNKVLSVTGEPASGEAVIDADGATVYSVTVSADEAPGGSDEYEFSRIQDADAYRELSAHLDGAWSVFRYLEQEGVVSPEAVWRRELEVFRTKLHDYLKTKGEEY